MCSEAMDLSLGPSLGILTALALMGCAGQMATATTEQHMQQTNSESQYETATFGAGCFWCTEAIFESLRGVVSVVSGYAGGHAENPTYKQVCTGTTGHAEVVQIKFDPKVITYEELLEVFFLTHDPTTPNRQGNDIGTQYRSIILYHNEEQKALAERVKAELDKAGAWDNPIVTEIVPFTTFYPAEEYHQDYFAKNPDKAYCQAVIRPKLEKFRKVFKAKLKSGVN